MPDMEIRTLPATFELREDTAPTLDGYAATFDETYDLGPFCERIERSAFNRTLGTNPDVRLLVDHEGQPLARTKSGTLALMVDERGLHARAQLDGSDPDVQRLLPKMRRGDLDQMSFAFRVPRGGDDWDHSGEKSLRTLRNVELQGGDVSVVTYPANAATSVSVRSVDEREVNALFVEAMSREVRAGRVISADNMTRLQRVLDSLATADDALDEAEAAVAEILGVTNLDEVEANAVDKKPYGDVTYADPGYQDDGKKRYPLDTEDHVRAAWSYINQQANQSPYTAEQLASIKSRIKAAAGKFGVEIKESNSVPLGLAQRIAERLSIPA